MKSLLHKMPVLLRALLLLLLGVACQPSHASQTRLQALTQRIDSLLATKALRPFNGLVHISQGGKTLYARSHGYADIVHKTSFPAHPQFVIGSVSKQVTAVLVLQACEARLLDLQTPIRQYLPELPLPWADTVTIHQLLNHTSGYQGRDRPLAHRAGARFSYSNQAYGLLGDILARVTGKSYEDLAIALLKRCHLRQSTTPGHAPHLLRGFVRQNDGTIVPDTTSLTGNSLPAALLISTPEDMAQWNKCLHQTRELLSQDAYARMTTGSSKRPHPIFGDVDYGYGVQMTQVDGISEISHGGYVPGFVSVNFYYPQQNISLVVMENLDWMDPAFKESFWFEMEIRRILRSSGLV